MKGQYLTPSKKPLMQKGQISFPSKKSEMDQVYEFLIKYKPELKKCVNGIVED
jgi:hypothetical protein